MVGMPIYEYRCGHCGKKSSALLPSYQSPVPACPHCGRPELKRLISSFATVRSGDSDDGGGDGDDFGGGFDGGDDDGGGGFDAGDDY